MGLCEVLPQQRDIIWFKVIEDYGKEEGIPDTHIVIQDPDSEQVWESVYSRPRAVVHVPVCVRVCVCVWAADCIRVLIDVGCVCVCVYFCVCAHARNFEVQVVRTCGHEGSCVRDKKKK